jgi:hypothetical protein
LAENRWARLFVFHKPFGDLPGTRVAFAPERAARVGEKKFRFWPVLRNTKMPALVAIG